MYTSTSFCITYKSRIKSNKQQQIFNIIQSLDPEGLQWFSVKSTIISYMQMFLTIITE